MKRFPIVRASGRNYEVGLVIGEKLHKPIKKLLSTNRLIFKNNFNKFLKRSKLFLGKTKKYFPQYIEELKGIADGAGVSFDEIFLSNNREVADFNPRILKQNHCTIIGIPKGDDYLLGHNEDWHESSLGHLYILDVTINNTKIFGLNYANSVIGDAVAINGHGLVQAINELSHQDTQVGVPKNFIARAILDCKTLEDTEKLMQKVPRAAGYNHVLVQGKRLWNIESSAREYFIEKVENEKYVHTNHYLTELRRIDKGNPESERRYAKVKKLLPDISDVEDIKKVLSDRTDPRICRTGTIGSVIFDTMQRIVNIAYGQPENNSYYSLKY